MSASANAPTDWSVLLDELKQKESITSDAQLAASFGVTRGYVCSVRKGRKRVSLELGMKIFDRLERTFELERLEQLFLPEKVRKHTTSLNTIKHYVIARANGYCQLCGMPAPFNSPDGQPYLEIHHVRPIAEAEVDSSYNLVALCPNCHRKIEVNASESDKKILLTIVAMYDKS